VGGRARGGGEARARRARRVAIGGVGSRPRRAFDGAGTPPPSPGGRTRGSERIREFRPGRRVEAIAGARGVGAHRCCTRARTRRGRRSSDPSWAPSGARTDEEPWRLVCVRARRRDLGFARGRARGRDKTSRDVRPFSRRSGESDASRERHPADRRGDLAISRAGLIGSPGRSRVKRRSRAGARSKDTVGRIDGRSTIDRPVGQIAPPPSAAARCIVLRASAVRRSGVAFASPPSRTRRSRARGILP
jgi:hypothetical protein